MGTATTNQSQSESLRALEEATAAALSLFAPPVALKVSEWAERNRFLPKGSSAKPGPWKTESYQRQMMDCILEPEVRKVVFKTSTQVGKSEILNNIIGYHIDAAPAPIMMVQPTDLTAKSYSKKRIAPMIENCPALKAKVREATTRRPGNEIRLKEFDGGFLKLAGANSAAGLRTDPIALLLFDEVDGYPEDVDGEGNPIEIAVRRTDTFWKALTVMVSTPGKPSGISRIEAEWNLSSQHEYHVPCPFCGERQVLCWRDANGLHRLRWEKDEEGKLIPGSVRYLCAHCDKGIEEKFKLRMLDAGRWIARHPKRRSIVGFSLNALYSPWQLNWDELAKEWVAAKDNPEKLRVFINLRLAETWDEGADTSLDATGLRARATEEDAEGTVPEGVCVLVCAADVQQNRIEAQITGFGPGEESWLIAHEIFWGNPGAEFDPKTEVNVWDELDAFSLRTYKHPAGVSLSPAITLVDSGAHADSVYNFVLPRQNKRRRVYACKGRDYLSKPGLVSEGKAKKAHIRLFIIGTYAAKDRIFARLKIPAPGPGYIHLPEWVTDEYLKQLTSEKKITVRVKRTRSVKRVYVKTQDRNEALDLTVYSHAALAVLQQFISRRYRDLSAVAASLKPAPTEKEKAPPKPKARSNWMKGW